MHTLIYTESDFIYGVKEMKRKPHQIQRIIDTFIEEKSIGNVVKITKYSKNTVKKYLREYGLIPYSYPLIQSDGPPSLVYRTTDYTHNEQNMINQLRDQVQLAYSQGANLKKAFDKKNIENDELTEKITQITTDKDKEIQEMK